MVKMTKKNHKVCVYKLVKIQYLVGENEMQKNEKNCNKNVDI